LRAVLDRAPKNLTAHERLFRVLLDEGDVDGARTAANAYVAVLRERGDDDAITVVQNEFTSRGHVLGGAPAPTPAEAPVEPEPEFAIDLTEPTDEISFDIEPPAVEFEE